MTPREYYFLHADALEAIYQAIRPLIPLSKCYINCPCGDPKSVQYLKLKQHICSKKHRKVLPVPLVADFL